MEKSAIRFAEENGIRLSIFLTTGIVGPSIIPDHDNGFFSQAIRQMLASGSAWHAAIPDGSASFIHVEDLAKLFLAAYQQPQASGRYFGVYDSWYWNELYALLASLIPEAVLPSTPVASPCPATTYDFSRRDSLQVALRDIPTLFKETIDTFRAQTERERH